MLGAILGDIVGSPFEFDHNNYKHKDFPLLSEKSHFTDDTVMTAAVAVGLIDGKGLPERTFCAVQHEMRFWGREYPHAGYGGMFRRWLHAENPNPYGSFGNGSAMRVSAAGWLFDTLDKTLEMAKVTAEVTHNHPEGIKGAQATAAVIFLARTGHSKPEIKQYVEQTFGYDLNRTCDEIRPTYHHVETCQETVPEAIVAFLESVSFEVTPASSIRLSRSSSVALSRNWIMSFGVIDPSGRFLSSARAFSWSCKAMPMWRVLIFLYFRSASCRATSSKWLSYARQRSPHFFSRLQRLISVSLLDNCSATTRRLLFEPMSR